jgi:hypothetical protein
LAVIALSGSRHVELLPPGEVVAPDHGDLGSTSVTAMGPPMRERLESRALAAGEPSVAAAR